MNINSKEMEKTANSTLLSWTKLPVFKGEGVVVVDMVDNMFFS